MPTTTRRTRISQYWHPVAAVDDITDQPQRLELLGRGLVAFRDEQGVAVLNDVCIHRGAALSKGWIENGRLTCPFHGWQYDRAGACQRIPALPQGAAIPRAARVRAFQVAERYGLVWVALEEPIAPIPSYPDGADTNPEFQRFDVGELVWQTSAGRAVENSMDISHFPYVHPYILGDPELPQPPVYDVQPYDEGIWYRTPREGYVPAGQERPDGFTEYRHAFPFSMFLTNSDAAGRASVLGVFYSPVAAKVTRAWRIVFRNFQPGLDRADEITRILHVLDQDREALESVRPEEIPVSLREELHLKVPDAASIAFRRWIETVDMLDLAPV
jgi:phenylpropionate dioxygenase-like ring-hydroxylating dioxygenase large terminal subunit